MSVDTMRVFAGRVLLCVVMCLGFLLASTAPLVVTAQTTNDSTLEQAGEEQAGEEEEEEETIVDELRKPSLRIILILPADPGIDAHAKLLLAGAHAAANESNVTIDVRFPNASYNSAELIVAAVDNKPEGIVITLDNPDLTASALAAAAQSSVAIATIGEGADISRSLGIFMHAGVTNESIGRQAGEQAKSKGALRSLCLTQDWQKPAHLARCQGFADGLNQPINILDLGTSSATALARLRVTFANEEPFDSIFIATHNLLPFVLRVMKEQPASSVASPYLIVHGTSATAARALEDSQIDAMIDGQPFLQSYLAVTNVVLRREFRLRGRGNMVT
ncbi:MAG: substrate-binding domain-containing protein, partial [Alphaproteobacteria bacterium]|nr:substrate-binding domain-containing protein [Alphaproteobacteria bacterium]